MFTPGQIVVFEAVAVAVGRFEIDTVNVTPFVLPPVHGEVCVLRTQYVVAVVGETVNVAPVCPDMVLFPIVFPVPHWNEVPEPPTAVNVTEAPGQIVKAPEMLVGAVAITFTVTVTTLDVAAEHGELVTIAR